MKKILCIVGIALLVLLTSINSLAASVETEYEVSPIQVAVDGKVIDFPDQKPVLVNDRTYVPIRFLAEALGCEVTWEEKLERVDIISGLQPKFTVTPSYTSINDKLEPTDLITKITYHLKIGKSQIVVARSESGRNGGLIGNNPNGDKMTEFIVIEIPNEPFLLNDRTMLPVRFVAEALGAFVYYDSTDGGTANIITQHFDDVENHSVLSTQIAPYVAEEVNKLRAEQGLNPISISPVLVDAATWKANEMATKKYYDHENKGYPGTRTAGHFFGLYRTGYYPFQSSAVAENIQLSSINTYFGEFGWHKDNHPNHDDKLYNELKKDWGFKIIDLFVKGNAIIPDKMYTPSDIIMHLCEDTYREIAITDIYFWKNSPGHYRNMMGKDHVSMGYGITNGTGTYAGPYSVQIFSNIK
ncbi:MAG: hypothetical protein BWY15_00739 [Firmicutes bacterium ADurb.Bin193]|nr:MAG: hypothetical protein BWY15_00739 [Firmicutes bacterium ADurb.Bin193]